MAENLLAVDEGAVAASHVFQNVSAVRLQDLRLLAADPAVAQASAHFPPAARCGRESFPGALPGVFRLVRLRQGGCSLAFLPDLLKGTRTALQQAVRNPLMVWKLRTEVNPVI